MRYALSKVHYVLIRELEWTGGPVMILTQIREIDLAQRKNM